MICYRGNQISQTGKGGMEILYKSVDNYLKSQKQEKGEWKHYTKPLININGFVTQAQYHGEIDKPLKN